MPTAVAAPDHQVEAPVRTVPGPVQVDPVPGLPAQPPQLVRVGRAVHGFCSGRGSCGGRGFPGGQAAHDVEVRAQPGVGHVADRQQIGAVLGQPGAQGRYRQLLRRPVQPLAGPGGLGRPADGAGRVGSVDGQQHVVAEAGHLVAVAAPLRQYPHAGDLRQAGGQRGEQARIDDQFLVVGDRAADPLQHLLRRQFRCGPRRLYRCVKALQQRQAAHVPDEEHAARRDPRDRGVQGAQQVLLVGEVLHDRVEHDDVEPSVG